MPEQLQKEGAKYDRPDEYLGDSLRDMDYDDGRTVVKKNTGPRQRSAEATDRPDFFLGGSGAVAASGPRRKLRTSWLGGDSAAKKEEPPPIPTPTKKWKPPASFKKATPPKAATHDGTSGLAERKAKKTPFGAQKEDIPEDKSPEINVEGEQPGQTPEEEPAKSGPAKVFGARAKLSSQSLPPSKFGLGSLKKTPSKDQEETPEAEKASPPKPVFGRGSNSVRDLGSEKPATPTKPAFGNSYSVRNMKSVGEQKPLSPSGAAPPFKLKHVEHPIEEEKPTSPSAQNAEDAEKPVMKRPSLRKVGFPPESGGGGGMDHSASEQKSEITNSTAKRPSLRKVGLPEGELDMSSSEQNHSPAENKSAEEAPLSPVKLKHVEHPAEEKKPHGDEAEKSMMKKPSLRKVGLPEGEMDQSTKEQSMDTSANNHADMDKSANSNAMDKSAKSEQTNGSHEKAAAAVSPKETAETKLGSPKASKKESKAKSPNKKDKLKSMKEKAAVAPPASQYAPTEDDFINCANHDSLLKKQEKEMERLRNEKEDLEKKIKKANKDFTKLENKLNTLKMVLDQGVKKEGMKNIWI